MIGAQPESQEVPMLDVIMRQISLNGVRAYTWSNCELGMRYPCKRISEFLKGRIIDLVAGRAPPARDCAATEPAVAVVDE